MEVLCPYSALSGILRNWQPLFLRSFKKKSLSRRYSSSSQFYFKKPKTIWILQVDEYLNWESLRSKPFANKMPISRYCRSAGNKILNFFANQIHKVWLQVNYNKNGTMRFCTHRSILVKSKSTLKSNRGEIQ